MNATTLIAAPAFDIAGAVIQASHWVVEARPVIIAYLALEAEADRLSGISGAAHGAAARIVERAAGDLYLEIEGLRTAAIDRLAPERPEGPSEEAWEAYEAARDALGQVIGVDAAIAAIDREPVL